MNTATVNIQNKEDLQVIRSLRDACSTDTARPVLTGICVENDHSRAVNGYILMELKTPACLIDHQGQTIKFLQTPRLGLNEIVYIDGQFPDTDQLISGLKYNRVFSVSASLLQRLIKSLPKDTQIFFELASEDPKNKPIVITGKDHKSLIMPMRLED